MKNRYFIWVGIFLLFACERWTDEPSMPSLKLAVVNYRGFSEPLSRTVADMPFEEGSRILLYSSGGVEADGIELVFNEGSWEGTTMMQWGRKEPARISAYYPSISPINMREENGEPHLFYWASDTVAYPGTIQLNFRPYYAKLVVQLPAILNESVSDLTFCPTDLIANVEPRTGEATLVENTSSQSKTCEKIENATYSYLIPIGNRQCNISIHTTNGRTLTTGISTANMQRGMAYIYHLIEKENTVSPGINSALDFIEFIKTIREAAIVDYAKYGIQIDGKWVFRLNKDITFTDDDNAALNKELNLYTTNNSFNEFFDGGGHSIVGLRLEVNNSMSYYGLFPIIGAQGSVNNLQLNKVNISTNKDKHYWGVLVGWCKGQVNNCSIKNVRITSVKDSKSEGGGFVGYLVGEMRNVGIDSLDCSSSYIQSAGLVDCLGETAKITNAIVSNMKDGSKSCAIVKASRSSNGLLNNIVVYNITNNKVISEFSSNDTHIYYLEGSNLYHTAITSKPDQYILPYDETYKVNEISLLDLLNQNVEKLRAEYPDIIRWKVGKTNPFVLETME